MLQGEKGKQKYCNQFATYTNDAEKKLPEKSDKI